MNGCYITFWIGVAAGSTTLTHVGVSGRGLVYFRHEESLAFYDAEVRPSEVPRQKPRVDQPDGPASQRRL